MRRFAAWLDGNLEDVLGLVLYVYLAVVVFVEVLSRYIFNSSSAWGEETAVYAFVWLAYLAASRPTRQRAHLNFDFMTSRLEGAGKTAAYLLSDACFLIVAVVMIVTSIPTVRNDIVNQVVMKGVQLPAVLASLSVPVGWSLIALRIVQRSIALVRGGPEKSRVQDRTSE